MAMPCGPSVNGASRRTWCRRCFCGPGSVRTHTGLSAGLCVVGCSGSRGVWLPTRRAALPLDRRWDVTSVQSRPAVMFWLEGRIGSCCSRRSRVSVTTTGGCCCWRCCRVARSPRRPTSSTCQSGLSKAGCATR